MLKFITGAQLVLEMLNCQKILQFHMPLYDTKILLLKVQSALLCFMRMRMILSTSVWYRLDGTSLISDISDVHQNIMVQFKTTRGDF